MRIALVFVAGLLVFTACADATTAGPDLEIERVTGYVVVVDPGSDGLSIGFSEDRDATSGTEYLVSESVWRIEDGPWLEPPVNCLGKGQRVELGISQVENEDRPGLLKDRVVWVACLAPEETG
jgi:hypothetical protein